MVAGHSSATELQQRAQEARALLRCACSRVDRLLRRAAGGCMLAAMALRCGPFQFVQHAVNCHMVQQHWHST